MLTLASSSPLTRADDEGSFSGSSAPSMAPRSAAALALSRRHGAAGDAPASDPANPAGREDDRAARARPRARSCRSGTRGRGARRPRDARARTAARRRRAAPAGRSGRPGAFGRVVVPAADDADQRDAGSAQSSCRPLAAFPARALQSRGREGRTRLPNAVVAGARGLRGVHARGEALAPEGARDSGTLSEAPRTARLGRRGKGSRKARESPFVAASRFALRS